MKKTSISRRTFLGGSAAAAVAFSIVPSHVLGQQAGVKPPSEKLNVVGIGVGGMGSVDVGEVGKPENNVNIIALCDVDERNARKTFEKFPSAKRYQDFRKMFDEMEKEIDAVTVSTPDHFHAVAAMAAIKRKKHVYCEKPLAHSIWEIRELMKAAKENNVVTQLGNQGHSSETIRMFCEWIQDGAIGKVKEIHCACNTDHCKIGDLPRRSERPAVPAEVNWDQWIGPAAMRPYHPMYMPGAWRGWSHFGSGTIGDWVCHVVDPAFWAFDLGVPTSVVAHAKDYDPVAHADTFPHGAVIKFEFAAKGNRGPITLWWHDGPEKMPRPETLDASRGVPDTGAVVIGENGMGITYGSHGAGGVRIYPEAKMRAYKQPAKTIRRARGSHQQDWLQAIREGRKAGSDFSYGGPLTEIAQLGIIATHLPGQELKWDGAACRFTNNEEANKYIKPTFREGWTL